MSWERREAHAGGCEAEPPDAMACSGDGGGGSGDNLILMSVDVFPDGQVLTSFRAFARMSMCSVRPSSCWSLPASFLPAAAAVLLCSFFVSLRFAAREERVEEKNMSDE